MKRIYFIALGLYLLTACGAAENGSANETYPTQQSSKYVDRVETMPAGFFRVWADIKVKSSGEIINLDYVVACGGQVTHWTYTEPSAVFGMYPHIMVVPTSTGTAIGARTPEVCDSYIWEEKNMFLEYGPDGPGKYTFDPVPDDFLPLLMWYPSVEDLSFAFGYISDVAYESPYAKMEVLDSGIAKSSQEDWLAWREKSKTEYQQQGALPGPWGYQMPGFIGSTREESARITELNGGRIPVSSNCYAVGVVELPDSIKADVLALLPENGREWVGFSEFAVMDLEEDRDVMWKLLKSVPFNGGSFFSHGRLYDELGVRRRSGGGAFKWSPGGGGNDQHVYYHAKYPMAVFQPRAETGNDPAGWEHHILFDEDWHGFGFCGERNPLLRDIQQYAAGETTSLENLVGAIWINEPQWIMDGDNIVITNVYPDGARNPYRGMLGSPNRVIARDGRIITYQTR